MEINMKLVKLTALLVFAMNKSRQKYLSNVENVGVKVSYSSV